MKICIIAGGGSVHVRRFTNFLAAGGHEVHLISSAPWRDCQGYDEGIKIYPLPRLFPQIWTVSRYFSGVLWLFQVRKLLKKIHPDVLDGHFLKINGYLGVISGFHPLVLTCMGSDILVSARQSLVHRILSGYSLRKAEAIVCRSSIVKEEIIKLGAQADKIHIILIGVDTNKFGPSQKNAELRRSLGISETAPIVISTRALGPIYDVETLVKAIPSVLKEIPETKFIIAGHGNQRGYLENLADSLQVAGSVKFVSLLPHDELAKYLASSDVYVSTSLSDGTSNSLLEAMASGLAPVVTDIPANNPWIEDEENGALFPVKDDNILAAKIIYLLKHNELRKKFGEINREIARRRAEHQLEMKRLERLYNELVKKRPER